MTTTSGVKRELDEISTADNNTATTTTLKASNGANASSKRQAHLNAAVSSQLKLCKDLLIDCCAHDFAFLFNAPVDVIGLGLTDYHDVIKQPMDFGTIRKRIDVSYYTSPSQFFDDMQLTFTNAMTYNPAGTDVHKMAKKLAKFFEKRWAVFTTTGTYDRTLFPPPQSSHPGLITSAVGGAGGAGVRGGRGGGLSRRGAGRLTIAERRNFTEQVARLEYDDAVRIAAIVRQRMPELEVDSIDAHHVLISVAKLRASVVREGLRVMMQMRNGTLNAAGTASTASTAATTTTAAAATTTSTPTQE